MPPYVADEEAFAILVRGGHRDRRRARQRRMRPRPRRPPPAARARGRGAARARCATRSPGPACPSPRWAPSSSRWRAARASSRTRRPQPLNPASVDQARHHVTRGSTCSAPRTPSRPTCCVTGELGRRRRSRATSSSGAAATPKLTYERLWQLVHQLRARGLREIRGDVILDRSLLRARALRPREVRRRVAPRLQRGPRRAARELQGASTSASCPTAPACAWWASPTSRTSRSRAACGLAKGPATTGGTACRYDVDENGLLATVVFSGTYPADCGEKAWPLSVFDADRYAESAFRWLWSEAGRALHRQGARRHRAGRARVLFYRFESEPLAALVRDINKFSNNVMARQLFLTLSAEKTGVAGRGAARARASCATGSPRRASTAPEPRDRERLGAVAHGAHLAPPSLAALLRAAWASPVMPELVSSLSLFAVDGTFKSKNGAFAGQAHLKGGTLTGVQAVAGFVLDAKGRRWIVVMIVNHDNANRAQAALDALVDWAYRGGK